MEGMELLSFQIISNVGDAKSYLHEALKASREERFDQAEEMIKKAEDSLGKAHDVHMDILAKESQGDDFKITLLLMHAEDQMMSTELLRDLTEEMLLTHRKYSK